MGSRAGEVKLARGIETVYRSRDAAQPPGPPHVRRFRRPRRRARVHARLDHAPRRGDDRDRLDRPGGGVRGRLPVAVLGRAARLAGIEGGGRLRQPVAVRRAVGLDRPHHRRFRRPCRARSAPATGRARAASPPPAWRSPASLRPRCRSSCSLCATRRSICCCTRAASRRRSPAAFSPSPSRPMSRSRSPWRCRACCGRSATRGARCT